MFSRAGLENALDVSFDVNAITTDPVTRELLVSSMRDARADAMLAGLKARGAQFGVRPILGEPGWTSVRRCGPGGDHYDIGVGSIDAQAHLAADGREPAVVDAAVRNTDRRVRRRRATRSRPLLRHGDRGHPRQTLADRSRVRCLVRARARSGASVRLPDTDGPAVDQRPGAISAQGAKGAVSSDGPESPERVQLNKGLVGFLTHTGYTHGGNGYEGSRFFWSNSAIPG